MGKSPNGKECSKGICQRTAGSYSARFVSCAEPPKTLQKPLGHASIKTTMDRYVHVTDDSMSKAVLQFEKTQQNQNGTVMVQ